MAAWPVGGSFWVSHSGTHSRQHTQRTPPSPLTKSPQTQETSNCTTGGRERAARTLMTIDVRPRALMPSCGQRQGAGRPQNQLGPSLLLPGAVCAQDPSPRHSQPCSKTSYVHPRERYWQCRAAGHHRAESQHPDQKPEPPPPPPTLRQPCAVTSCLSQRKCSLSQEQAVSTLSRGGGPAALFSILEAGVITGGGGRRLVAEHSHLRRPASSLQPSLRTLIPFAGPILI